MREMDVRERMNLRWTLLLGIAILVAGCVAQGSKSSGPRAAKVGRHLVADFKGLQMGVPEESIGLFEWTLSGRDATAGGYILSVGEKAVQRPSCRGMSTGTSPDDRQFSSQGHFT